jgi:predicted transcriptional regulator
MKAFSRDQPISCVVDHMAALDPIGVDDTVEIVFKSMLTSEKEEIFVFDKGVAVGLITCQDIRAPPFYYT